MKRTFLELYAKRIISSEMVTALCVFPYESMFKTVTMAFVLHYKCILQFESVV